jgi:tripartite-type tricarboxylate transporter receptor subunit TctC
MLTLPGLSARIALAAACLLPLALPASALDYPTRQPHIIVGYPPGGSTDIVARLIGNWLSKKLGQSFIVENKPGAGNNLGTEAVVRAKPDGYTLLLINPANTINASLYKHLNFNFLKDIDPVANVIRVPNVMEVNPAVPAKTVAEFIAYAKANPGKISMASSGVGTPQHLYGELFKMMAGIEMTHVPYRGSPQSLTGLFAGETQVIFDTLATSIEHIKAGRLRALAVTSAARAQSLPDVPTVGEFLPGYEATSWQGLGAPKGTPVEIIDRLSRETSAAIADPLLKSRIESLGYATFPISTAELARCIADETEKWAKVIRAANIKAN